MRHLVAIVCVLILVFIAGDACVQSSRPYYQDAQGNIYQERSNTQRIGQALLESLGRWINGDG